MTFILDDTEHRFLVSSLALIMALLVAQTRVEAGVHSTLEVAVRRRCSARSSRSSSSRCSPHDRRRAPRRAPTRSPRARTRRTRASSSGARCSARDGRVFEGVNVENAAYPLGVCAERTAFSARDAAGYRPGDFDAIGITASPCGGCRQWLPSCGSSGSCFRSGDGEFVDDARRPSSCPDTFELCVKSGFVAVAGRPNVGKSTLVNALARREGRDHLDGAAHDAAPHLRGRERRRLAARARRPAGLPAADGRAHRAHAGDGRRVVRGRRRGPPRRLGAATGSARATASSRERVFALGVPVVIAVNKIDRLKHGHVASQMKAAATLGDFHALHPVSAKMRDGIDELRDDLVSLLPEGPALLPARAANRPDARGAHRRGDPREGAPPDARRGAARARPSRSTRSATSVRARVRPRRDRVAEGDPRRQGRAR